MNMENMNPPVGMPERIRECVLKMETSIVQTAKTLGISRSRLYNYMNGAHMPNAKIIEKMCILFNVSADWLIFGDK